MSSSVKRGEIQFVEFVIIVSLMMSMMALSIDTMMPALPQIATELQVQNENNRQLIISSIFLGLSVGQLFFGPLSDKTGRKPAIYAGFLIFIAGALLSVFSTSFPLMLAGRLIQGVGISSPRAVTLALVRDRYEGRLMARVMSFATTVLILVPMIAPSFGQIIIMLTGWRAIFVVFILIAIISLSWFAIRMPETLTIENRIPFSIKKIMHATFAIVKTPVAMGYTISAGLVGGAFLGYLNSAQQIFQEQYFLGDYFPLVFGTISLSLGLASFLNARLVMRLGMRYLVKRALWIILTIAIIFLLLAIVWQGTPPLWLLIVFLMATFFCIGILFGNLNALAMQPLGRLAGLGSAIVGSFSTLIQLALGTLIGQNYNGTIFPLIIGIGSLIGITILVEHWAELERSKLKLISTESTLV